MDPAPGTRHQAQVGTWATPGSFCYYLHGTHCQPSTGHQDMSNRIKIIHVGTEKCVIVRNYWDVKTIVVADLISQALYYWHFSCKNLFHSKEISHISCFLLRLRLHCTGLFYTWIIYLIHCLNWKQLNLQTVITIDQRKTWTSAINWKMFKSLFYFIIFRVLSARRFECCVINRQFTVCLGVYDAI